jgi:hypothetical protein
MEFEEEKSPSFLHGAEAKKRSESEKQTQPKTDFDIIDKEEDLQHILDNMIGAHPDELRAPLKSPSSLQRKDSSPMSIGSYGSYEQRQIH